GLRHRAGGRSRQISSQSGNLERPNAVGCPNRFNVELCCSVQRAVRFRAAANLEPVGKPGQWFGFVPNAVERRSGDSGQCRTVAGGADYGRRKSPADSLWPAGLELSVAVFGRLVRHKSLEELDTRAADQPVPGD